MQRTSCSLYVGDQPHATRPLHHPPPEAPNIICLPAHAAIKAAVEAGESVNEVEAAGNTPLHSAAYEGWIEGAQLLLSLGAKVNASNNAGDRPWHWAQNMDHDDMMAFLEKVRSAMRCACGVSVYTCCCTHAYLMGASAVLNQYYILWLKEALAADCMHVLQNGAKTGQGDVLVPDHVPKVKVHAAILVHACMHASMHVHRPLGPQLPPATLWYGLTAWRAHTRRTSSARTAGRTTPSRTRSSWSGARRRTSAGSARSPAWFLACECGGLPCRWPSCFADMVYADAASSVCTMSHSNIQ